MLRYALNLSKEKSVKVLGRGLRISRKNSTLVCREISGMSLPKAKALVERLVSKQQDLDGKYYTNASTQILEMLKSAENNAEFKGLEAGRLIVNASAHQGFRFFRPRRFKNRRQRRKVTNIQLVLQER
jgi:large subunit ribosomal protein L22